MTSLSDVLKTLADQEDTDLYRDALLRIAFRPRWNFTWTITKRKNDSNRLWSEVENYLAIRHPDAILEKFLNIRDRITNAMEEVGYDIVMLCKKDNVPSKARACYDEWHEFLKLVTSSFDMNLKDYITGNLQQLLPEERNVLISIRACLPVPEIESAYMKSEPSLSSFECVSKHHGDLSLNLYIRTLVKAGLADWALHALEWFRDGHLDSSKRLVDFLQDDFIIPPADSVQQPEIEVPNLLSLVDDRIEKIIYIIDREREVHLVVCPFCGAKTPQGTVSCRNCNAAL